MGVDAIIKSSGNRTPVRFDEATVPHPDTARPIGS